MSDEATAPLTSVDIEPIDDALKPFAPGEILQIACGAISVDIAPEAGGRIAQIRHAGVDWLQSYGAANTAMIAWGCFPMLPWAGRIRNGRFVFQGRHHQLPPSLGHHAIHGVAYALPWQVESHSASRIELSLQLPEDERWPFGGCARQRIETGAHWLRMALEVSAGARAMPAVIGWHPWLRKPEHLDFQPDKIYPRDADGIATAPITDPTAPPWDDCFINPNPVVLKRQRQNLRLSSDCAHWVVYNEPENTTCIEPQSGPPDAFNLEPSTLAPGETRSGWFLWEWH